MEYKQWRENRRSRELHACASVLLQHVDSFRGGGLVEAPHVVVHLREALLHVILGAALPYRPETEAQGGMVQLKGGGGEVTEVDGGGEGNGDGAHITFHSSRQLPEGFHGYGEAIILRK